MQPEIQWALILAVLLIAVAVLKQQLRRLQRAAGRRERQAIYRPATRARWEARRNLPPGSRPHL